MNSEGNTSLLCDEQNNLAERKHKKPNIRLGELKVDAKSDTQMANAVNPEEGAMDMVGSDPETGSSVG